MYHLESRDYDDHLTLKINKSKLNKSEEAKSESRPEVSPSPAGNGNGALESNQLRRIAERSDKSDSDRANSQSSVNEIRAADKAKEAESSGKKKKKKQKDKDGAENDKIVFHVYAPAVFATLRAALGISHRDYITVRIRKK